MKHLPPRSVNYTSVNGYLRGRVCEANTGGEDNYPFTKIAAPLRGRQEEYRGRIAKAFQYDAYLPKEFIYASVNGEDELLQSSVLASLYRYVSPDKVNSRVLSAMIWSAPLAVLFIFQSEYRL